MQIFHRTFKKLFSFFKVLIITLLTIFLLACGQDVEIDERKVQDTINVMGVDGPMANATINLYKLQWQR